MSRLFSGALLSSILCCLLALPSYAALPAATQFIVWTTGSDANAGCYVVGASGTDFSQQASAQFSGTDLVIDATTNTNVTSASHNFVATDVGDCVNVSAGSGFTTGIYEIVSVASNIATLDRAVGTASSTGGTWAEGGAFSTAAKAAANYVAGNTIAIKATATYGVTATTTFTTNGTAIAPVEIIGYTSTVGDGGQATMQISSGTNIQVITLTGNFLRLRNFILDVNTSGSGSGCVGGVGAYQVFNLECKNWTTGGQGITVGTHGQYYSGILFSAGGGTRAAFYNASGFRTTLEHFVCKGISTSCIDTANAGTYLDGAISGTTGSNTDAILITGAGTSASPLIIDSVTVDVTTRDGVRFSTAAGADFATIRNSVFSRCVGVGINSISTNYASVKLPFNFNAFYNNGTNYTQVPAGANDVVISGSYPTNYPFTTSGSDLTPNATTGAGALLRGVGYPPLYVGLGTNYRDIGGIQHQATGSSATVGYPIGN